MTERTLRVVGRINAPPPWMERSLVTAVMGALDVVGPKPGALFVGGCVRDSLLSRPRDTVDIDVATVHPPLEVQRRLGEAGIRTIAPGIDHGTVTALPSPGHTGSVEITTLRRDVRTFGRRAEVEFSDDWVADAERRDFTFNALYAGPDLRIFAVNDLGLQDLARGRVRFMGTAAHRIHEDYLRILRYFRMFAWFGGQKHDRVNLNAIAKALPGLQQVSGERLKAELIRLLEADSPVPAVHAMAVTGTLQRILGGWSNPASAGAQRRLRALGRLVRMETLLSLADPYRRLCALVDSAFGAAQATNCLRLSRTEGRRLRAAAAAGPPPTTRTQARRQIWEAEDRGLAVDRLLLGAARTGRPARAVVGQLIRFMATWTPPQYPLGGDDVIQLGVPPGPERQALLRAVEAWWADRDFAHGRESCLAELRRRAQQPDA